MSTQQDLVLLLIKKELQGRKFIQELDRLGFDSMLFSTELEDIILSFMGFLERGDEFWQDYEELVSSYVQRVELDDPDTASEQALEFYFALREKL